MNYKFMTLVTMWMNRNYWIWIIYIIFIGCQEIKGLHLTAISVPDVVDVRESATLSCTYNMGENKLNSVKWYKDESEFFRYTPMMRPNILTFPVVGVTLARDQTYFCNKQTCSITLDDLESKTTGSYRCEISGEAPEFKLISKAANMTIAALPKHDPIISGVSHSYEEGEFLIANCTSDMSSPPASLSWYINDEMAPSEFVQPQKETMMIADGFQLRIRNLELRFFVDKTRFGNFRNTIRLRCLAKLEQINAPYRESSVVVFVQSTADDLSNQMLINSRNQANQNQWNNIRQKISLIFFAILITLATIQR